MSLRPALLHVKSFLSCLIVRGAVYPQVSLKSSGLQRGVTSAESSINLDVQILCKRSHFCAVFFQFSMAYPGSPPVAGSGNSSCVSKSWRGLDNVPSKEPFSIVALDKRTSGAQFNKSSLGNRQNSCFSYHAADDEPHLSFMSQIRHLRRG